MVDEKRVNGNVVQIGVIDPEKGFNYLSEDDILSRMKKLKLTL